METVPVVGAAVLALGMNGWYVDILGVMARAELKTDDFCHRIPNDGIRSFEEVISFGGTACGVWGGIVRPKRGG
eukprot:3229322-Amphidinium_carterae.1